MLKSSKADLEWFSAADLAEFGKNWVAGLPTTSVGCKGRAVSKGWESRQVQGKGGPNGLLTEYKPPQEVLEAIRIYIADKDTKANYEPSESITAPKSKESRAKYASVDALFELSANEEQSASKSLVQKKYTDAIYIEQLTDVRAAAGGGQVTPTDQVSVMVAINAVNWRNRVGANADKVKIITVYGDSMEGTLSHGDQVFVDTACNKFIDDAIYVIMQDDLLRIKRVKLKLDGSILVKSDNENGFGVEEYSADQAANFRVIGKVLPFKFGQFKM